MTKEELLDAIRRNAYSPEHVDVPERVSIDHTFDEGLSVRQNREMAEARNREHDEKSALRRQAIADAEKRFGEDLSAMLVQEYKLNAQQARKIQGAAYEHSHAYGHADVAQTASDIAALYLELDMLRIEAMS